MKIVTLSAAAVAALLRATPGRCAASTVLRIRPLRGGLESPGVVHVTVQLDHRPQPIQEFVMKRLDKARFREARIYEEILPSSALPCSPALLGIERIEGECLLYLEVIRPVNRWPWSCTTASGEVLRRLAELHANLLAYATCLDWLTDWDYETELSCQAQGLLKFIDQNSLRIELADARATLPALSRMVCAIAELRRQLFAFAPFGRALIHGDVHTGNVMMRKTADGQTPVFLDWGRSRIGSPLEDVSSWLQSLGYWETQARRHHDTLLRMYLSAHGRGVGLTRDVRDAYWLAAASNVLAGALLYHLSVAIDSASVVPKRRHEAIHAARNCLRIIRRADACWTSGARAKASRNPSGGSS